MIKFYFNHAPNPKKIALFLQESGLDFEPVPVDNMKGEQHGEAFRKINPNSKLPAIEDDGKRVFDSNAILLYLADKHGIFNGKAEDRSELLSWLMFIGTGLGPYSGQSVHFRHMAPESLDYAINRYLREAQRHYQILDEHLAGKDYFVSDEFTIVDISAWGWIDRAEVVLGENPLADYPNVKRWFDGINARPSVAPAREIGKDVEFKTERDEVASRAMFPQNYPATA